MMPFEGRTPAASAAAAVVPRNCRRESPPLMRFTASSSIRDSDFPRNDGPRTRQAAETSEVSKESENGDEDDEFDAVAGARTRNDLPHQPECRLRPAHRPHRSIEIPTLVPFTFRRRLYARQLAERSQHPDQPGQRKIRVPIDRLQVPLAGGDGPHEPGNVQESE